MFKKTRTRIVLTVLLTLVLFVSAVFAAVYGLSFREIRRQSEDLLARYAEAYSPDPGAVHLPRQEDGGNDGLPRDDLPENAPDRDGRGRSEMPRSLRDAYQLSTFYAVVFSPDGEVLELKNGSDGIYTDDEIVALARSFREEGESGSSGSLYYRVDDRDRYVLVAMIDDTVIAGSIRTILRYTALAGGAALVIALALAVFFADRIVRPLEENDRKQKQFISDASHELKTPVSVIGANAELLARQGAESEWLSNIRYETERMGQLVTDLLDLSRAESASFEPERIDLSRLVTEAALLYESIAFEKDLSVQTNIAEDVFISGSPARVKQLCSILLDNAVSHAEGGREIVVSLREEGHRAVLSVSNPGNIPPERINRLFERFYRADEARGDDGHYGLGLSIARAVAESHKGSVGVVSRDGIVTFTVKLPLAI